MVPGRNSDEHFDDLGVTLRRPPSIPMARLCRPSHRSLSKGASWGKVRGQTESSVASLRRLIIEVWPRKGEG